MLIVMATSTIENLATPSASTNSTQNRVSNTRLGSAHAIMIATIPDTIEAQWRQLLLMSVAIVRTSDTRRVSFCVGGDLAVAAKVPS